MNDRRRDAIIDATLARAELVQRWLLAAHVRGSGEAALGHWAGWLDHAARAGLDPFGRGRAEVGAGPRRLCIEVPGTTRAVASVTEQLGASHTERMRFEALMRDSVLGATWVAEDDDGFEGGFALQPQPDLTGRYALMVKTAFPTAGVAKAMALATSLGLGSPVGVRRVVNPGAPSTTLAWRAASTLAIWDAALSALVGEHAAPAAAALVGMATGPCELLLRAGDGGVTALGLRVPSDEGRAVAAAFIASGRTSLEQHALAAVVGALGARPTWVELWRSASGGDVRVGGLVLGSAA